MRILHLDAGREMRGGQWQVLCLLRGLRERGHAVKLLARAGSPLLDRALSEGFDAAPLGWVDILRERADAVHAHDARSHTVAALAGAERLVVSRRVAFPIGSGVLSEWKYRRARHYIAISQCVASELTRAGIKPEAITVVYDGVPACPVTTGLADGRVVAPATADPQKGSDLASAAAALAGVSLEFSRDLAKDLRSARVLLYATRSEGLGSGVLLAMAHGVPVVASRVGGLVEAVEHGLSGLLADNTPDDLASSLRRVLENPVEAQRLGEAGRARAARCFSVGNMVENTIRVYEKVLG